uniref:Uncharacterized protein n=1 Tax=Picea sitchensis TaxID=3332 RepID=A9P2I4_PICSI|nr:unknown [Picea sitchensis]
MQNSEDISRAQFDILARLSRFERTLDFPQTEIEGFVNEGRAIDNNQRIIIRVVNAISRNIITTGLIYKTVNTGEAQEILKAITGKSRNLRSLIRLGDEDINLLQPAGTYPVSHLHTNLQIVSLYLQGLEEQIDQVVIPTAVPESTGTIGQQHPPVHDDDVLDNPIYDDYVLDNPIDDDDVLNKPIYDDYVLDNPINYDDVLNNPIYDDDVLDNLADDYPEYLRRDDDGDYSPLCSKDVLDSHEYYYD